MDEEGKPVVEDKNLKDVSVSLSHKKDLLISTAGYWPQGCDIEVIQGRTEHDWLALLGSKKYKIYQDISAYIADTNLCATAVWCAYEVMRKIENKHYVLEKFCLNEDKGCIQFASEQLANIIILVSWVDLTRGGKKVLHSLQFLRR